jgi:hypothetical protein
MQTEAEVRDMSKQTAAAGDGGQREPEPTDLTIGSLIAAELSGKATAIGRYDSILWKIRTGYLAALYIAIAIAAASKTASAPLTAFVVVAALSLGALAIDLTFLWSKLRVVVGRDELVRVGLQLAVRAAEQGRRAVPDERERQELLSYLVNSGESTALDPRVRTRWWQFRGAWLPLVLYAIGPILTGLAWAVGVEQLVVPLTG